VPLLLVLLLLSFHHPRVDGRRLFSRTTNFRDDNADNSVVTEAVEVERNSDSAIAGGGGSGGVPRADDYAAFEEEKTNDDDRSRSRRRSSGSGSGKTPCEMIHPEDLPPECSCREPGRYSLVVECAKRFESTYWNDTIGLKIDLEPCDPDGSKLSIDVTEANRGIDYPVTGIRAGESKNIPIPGLSIVVPGLGHLGGTIRCASK